MIVLSFKIIHGEDNKIEIKTKKGISVIWGWGDDELVSFAAEGEDKEALEQIKKQLKKIGYKGTNTINKKVFNKVTKLLNENRYTSL